MKTIFGFISLFDKVIAKEGKKKPQANILLFLLLCAFIAFSHGTHTHI